jgi:hypothetical protein
MFPHEYLHWEAYFSQLIPREPRGTIFLSMSCWKNRLPEGIYAIK